MMRFVCGILPTSGGGNFNGMTVLSFFRSQNLGIDAGRRI